MIAVTGASGAVGGRVARRLAERGEPLRLCVRDAAKAPELAGAEVRDGADYADGEAMRRAFEGADAVFLVSAFEAPDRVDQHRTAVDAAAAAGVGLHLCGGDARGGARLAFHERRAGLDG